MPDESTGLTSQREDRPDKTVSISWRPLCLILVLSLGIRVWWLMNKVTVIEGEGANYARLAENLATGKGWVGTGGQADLFYPPLFSLFIAGAFRALHNAELAGRLISISFGMLLIIPIFLISREIYYQAVGYIAALIAALHPFFVSVSATVYAESTYSFFLFMGIYYGIRSARRLSSREAIMAGLMLGLAWLT
jgi:4-amino-4-deoxy-L-arabinose transferase-like glycosyltransferase